MPGFAWVLLALGAVVAALCAPVTLLAAHRTGHPPRLELRWLFLRLALQKLAQRQAARPPKKSPKGRAKPRPAAPPGLLFSPLPPEGPCRPRVRSPQGGGFRLRFN